MRKILYPVLFAFFSMLLIFAWTEKPRYELENNIIRLHIIANSDSEEDQKIKLDIRDKITEYAQKNNNSLSLKKMKQIADTTLKDSGFAYTSDVNFGKTKITRRKYGSFYLPEGMYKAVNINLGNGNGKNWWCVLSPPLCFTDSVLGNTDKLSEYLSNETNSIISGTEINIKFRILEIASEITSLLSNYNK